MLTTRGMIRLHVQNVQTRTRGGATLQVHRGSTRILLKSPPWPSPFLSAPCGPRLGPRCATGAAAGRSNQVAAEPTPLHALAAQPPSDARVGGTRRPTRASPWAPLPPPFPTQVAANPLGAFGRTVPLPQGRTVPLPQGPAAPVDARRSSRQRGRRAYKGRALHAARFRSVTPRMSDSHLCPPPCVHRPTAPSSSGGQKETDGSRRTSLGRERRGGLDARWPHSP